MAWDVAYAWNALKAAVSLDTAQMGVQIAQAFISVPLLLLRAQHLDPVANGALAAMRVYETCLLVHNVAPLLMDSKVAKDKRLMAGAEEEEAESSGWESPKHRPWKSAAFGDELRLDDEDAANAGAKGRLEGDEGGGAGEEDALYHDLKVVFGYTPTDERMLELREGEMVRVVAEQDGWFFAIDCDGNEGFVPPDYLEPISATDDSTSQADTRSPSRNAGEEGDLEPAPGQEGQG